MTDDELKELQEEYPNAWWNINYEEYEINEDDFYRAWDEECVEYFDYCRNYEPAGWPEWFEENWDLYNSDNGDVYGNLMLNALYYEKWNIAESFDSGDDIPRDAIMSAFFSKDMRKQMQWLLDHNCHRRDDHLWSTWQRLCFEWDNESDEDEEEDDDVESLKEKIEELESDLEFYKNECSMKDEEINRLQEILDENDISY